MTITLAARNAAFARLLAYNVDIHTPNVEAAIEALVEVARKAKTAIHKLPEKRIEAVVFELGLVRTNGNVEAFDNVEADMAMGPMTDDEVEAAYAAADERADADVADVAARTAEEPAKAPRKGAHADCMHSPTKVARAACRRERARVAAFVAVDADGDDCEGHESLANDAMGATVYCDGTCRAKA